MKKLAFKISLILSLIAPVASLADVNLVVNGSIELMSFPRYLIKGTSANFSEAGFDDIQKAELEEIFSTGFPVVYFDKLNCVSGVFEINAENIRSVFFPSDKPDYHDGVYHLVNLEKVNCSSK